MIKEQAKRKSTSEIREEMRKMEIGVKVYIDNPEDVGRYRLEAANYKSYTEREYRVLQDELKAQYVYRVA